MKNHIRASLVVVSVMFLIWGMGFIMFPETMHETLSAGTFDKATAALFAATMVGLSLVFLITAQDPQRDIVYGLAATLGFLGIASGLSMLPEGGMNTNGGTLVSLIVTIGVAVYLFVAQSEQLAGASGSARRSTARKTSTKKGKKKTTKKKTASKAKKKAKKKARKRR